MRRRIFRRFWTGALAVVGLVSLPGVAAASVIVPPGGSGHACSPYSYVQTNPNLYWQTCAWADYNYVYFTVHLGNASPNTWTVQRIYPTFVMSGIEYRCHNLVYYGNFPVPPHSVVRTPIEDCRYLRARAAFAARARVVYNFYDFKMTSETLQVQ